jgi:hypothetical protein
MRKLTDSIVSYAPLITGFLIFSGVTKAMLYYKAFNIDILPYLDFSEALLLFLDELLFLAIITCSEIFIAAQADHAVNKKLTSIRAGRLIKNSLTRRGIFYLLLILLNAWIFIVYPYQYAIRLSLCIIVLILIINFSIKKMHVYERAYRFKEKKYPKPLYTIGPVVLIFFTLLNIITGYTKAIDIIYLKKWRHFAVAFLEDDKKVQSSDCLLFVGRTNNYVFFYNVNTETSTIIPTEEIKEFKTK